MTTPELDADFDIEAPEIEGDGYFQDKTLQWADLCPHMGTPEKSLLRTLTNLTTKRSRQRRIRPDELRQMVYTGPTKIGEAPKFISPSGLLRLLRNLAAIGQITDRDGGMLRFSSRESARSRPITMTVWRYPRHDCHCPRNVFDALDIIRGQDPKWKPAGVDESAFHRPDRAGQEVDPSIPAGQEVNPAGQEVNPAGQEVNPAGQEVNPDSRDDLHKRDSPSSPPSSPPSSSSSSHPGGSTSTPASREPMDEEEGAPSAGTQQGVLPVDLVVEATDATPEEAAALVEILRPEAKKSLEGLIRRMAKKDDLTHRLWLLRRERAPQPRAGGPQGRRITHTGPSCSLHSASAPCQACRIDLNAGGPEADEIRQMYLSLGSNAAELRPDLAAHPTITTLVGSH